MESLVRLFAMGSVELKVHLGLGLYITDWHKLLWGMFTELIWRSSTDRAVFPKDECAECHIYTLGGVLKDLQVNSCIRFSQIPGLTENWNNPCSSFALYRDILQHTMLLG